MLSVHNLSMINKYLADGIRNGLVTAYGKYDGDSVIESVVYFFLIDKDGDVIAMILVHDKNVNNHTTNKLSTFLS